MREIVSSQFEFDLPTGEVLKLTDKATAEWLKSAIEDAEKYRAGTKNKATIPIFMGHRRDIPLGVVECVDGALFVRFNGNLNITRDTAFEILGNPTLELLEIASDLTGNTVIRNARIVDWCLDPNGSSLASFKNAVLDALVVACIYTKEHETNGDKALNDLLAYEVRLALDPAVSLEARKLIELGKAKASESTKPQGTPAVSPVTFTSYDLTQMRPCIKRPIIVHAMQMHEPFTVNTDRGIMHCQPGDYLMRGVSHELYVCEKEVFESTYDFVEAE